MTGTSSSRGYQAALIAIAVGAFALRVFPFFGPDGALGYRVDYDEGVYFSAASYLLQGVLPYRDFVFVHPPTLLFFVALTSAWTAKFLGVAGAFGLARWIAALLGALNTYLVGRVVWRGGVPWAALLSAAFYATYSEVVQVERGAFLEPLLNLVCLLLVLSVTNKKVVLAAVLGGLALSIKLWAGIWVLGALWAIEGTRGRVRFLAIATATATVFVLPLALLSPAAFFTEVGLFHAWRPPDGTVARLERLTQIVSVRHLASPLLALLAVVLRRRWDALAKVSVTAWGLTLLAFFASAAWWNQYNAHLIASEALVAGGLFALLAPRWRVVLALFAAVSVSMSIAHTLRRSRTTNDEYLALARSPLRDTRDCVFTFEPGLSLVASRLPPRETGPLVDSYASQLLSALKDGQRFPTSEAAFAASAAPAGLAHCRFVLGGERATKQASLEATHQLVTREGLQVWELR